MNPFKKNLYKWFIWLFTYYAFSEFYILINNLQELTEESDQIYLVAQKVHLGRKKLKFLANSIVKILLHLTKFQCYSGFPSFFEPYFIQSVYIIYNQE